MKPKIPLLAGFALCCLITAYDPASAQGTALTYQGRLNDGANPPNGAYDLTFVMFDAGSGAGQAGRTVTDTSIGVS